MFHSFRYFRAQLSASSFTEPGMQLMTDVALGAWRTPLVRRFVRNDDPDEAVHRLTGVGLSVTSEEVPRVRPGDRTHRLDGFVALARAEALQRVSGAVCRMHGIHARVDGRLANGPAIYVCNHLGYVDPVVICSLIPCAPISKVEIASWPGIGTLARRLGVIFVQRDDTMSATRALLAAKRRLEAGVNVLNFPEGTTTSGEILPFRRGIFGLAMRMGVPVVPLAMSFDDPALCWVDDASFLVHYSTELFGKPHGVELRVGPEMFARADESADQFAARVRRWIASARRPSIDARAVRSFDLAVPPRRLWVNPRAAADPSTV